MSVGQQLIMFFIILLHQLTKVECLSWLVVSMLAAAAVTVSVAVAAGASSIGPRRPGLSQ